jgi:hypothetical protein
MFGFIKRLLGLETPAPKKAHVAPKLTVVETPVPVAEVVVPTVNEEKPKKKPAPKKTAGTRKPRKKKD